MSDEASLDPDIADRFATMCTISERTLEDVYATVASDLSVGGLAMTSTRFLVQAIENLQDLGRYLRLKAEEIRFADSPRQPAWLSTHHLAAASALTQLLTNLDHPYGRCIFERPETFELTSAIRTMPNAEWHTLKRPPGLDWSERGVSYRGGGAVVGFDGELYPLVIAQVSIDGQIYNADHRVAGDTSVRSLLGADPGWELVDYRTGVSQFEKPLSGAAKDFVNVSLMLGTTMAPAVDASALQYVHMEPGMRATLLDAPTALAMFAAAQPTKPGNSPYGPDLTEGYEPTLPAGPPSPSGTARMNVASMAITAFNGALVGATLDDATYRAWEVSFEHNDDGRRRALMTSYAVNTSVVEDETVLTLVGWHNFVDESGQLRNVPVSYAPAGDSFEMVGARATNSFDPATDFGTNRQMFPE